MNIITNYLMATLALHLYDFITKLHNQVKFLGKFPPHIDQQEIYKTL